MSTSARPTRFDGLPVDDRSTPRVVAGTIASMPRRNPALPAALRSLHAIAADQGGTCTRQQARDAGLGRDAVDRLIGRGLWLRIHRGVYLTEPGQMTLQARMWAAHLALGRRSVIGGRTAAAYWGLAPYQETAPITVLVPEPCTRTAPGTSTRRVPDPAARAHPARRPPVTTVEHTVCDAAAWRGTDADAAEIVMRACRLRLTSPERILEVMAARPRQGRRNLLTAMCSEIQDGVTSPLERAYATRVTRAHGLPSGQRQMAARTTGGRRAYRDVAYPEHGVLVELDGRTGHEAESDVLRDQWRDNVATLTGMATLRFGWLAVCSHPCAVAQHVAALLTLRGWDGTPRACGPTCPVAPALAARGGRS